MNLTVKNLMQKKYFLYLIGIVILGVCSWFLIDRSAVATDQEQKEYFLEQKDKKEIEQYLSASVVTNHLLDSLYKVALLEKNAVKLSNLSYRKILLNNREGKRDSILFFGQRGLDYVSQTHDKLLQAQLNYEIGVFYSTLQNYTKSLNYLLQAKREFEEIDVKNGIGHTNNILGNVYFGLEKKNEAILYYDKAQQVFKESNDLIGQALVSGNRSRIDISSKNYSTANKRLLYTLSVFEQLKDTVKTANALLLLGDTALEQNNYKQALDYYNSAYQLSTAPGNKELNGHILLHYGKTYIALDDFDNAMKFYKQGYVDVDHTTDVENLELIAQEYYKRKNYLKAYEYNALYNKITDSIKGAEVQLNTAILKWDNNIREEKYKNKLLVQEKEIEQQEFKSKSRKFVTITVACVLVVLVLALMYRNRVKSMAIIQLEKEKLEEEVNAELEYQKLLKQQHKIELKAKEKIQEVELKQRKLEVETKNRELVSLNLQLLSKSKLLNELQLIVNSKKDNSSTQVTKISQVLKYHLDHEKDWNYFQEIFKNIHPKFFEKLQRVCPELTKTEMRICAYIKINMSNNEIAALLGISPNSVLTNRYRIRKKIEMERVDNLDEWIQTL
ncbi:MAG: LuxR C-terminal-related transcriptional regulator [Flavobacteriaceae bacterium]|jgi:DNA-binding CsgD family transcriptional regulator|nr:LuxR C-terminal-related transcriptional regulator [Flavobacteriaceae bacterium]